LEEKKQAATNAAEKKAGKDPSMILMTAPPLTQPKNIRDSLSRIGRQDEKLSIDFWKDDQLTVSKTKI